MKSTFQIDDIILIGWLILLLPWVPMCLLILMAFDAGPTLATYMIVGSVWTYPISVIAVVLFRKKQPYVLFLPALNILGAFSDVVLKSH